MISAATRGLSMAAAVRITVVFLLFCVACMIAIARMKGLWLDEVWSLWMSRHDLGFADAARERWLHDTNPPFFYMAAWMAEPLTRLGVFGARLLNLLPLLFLAASASYLAVTRPALRAFVLVFAVLVAASPAFLRFFGEDRSYFSQLSFAATLALGLYAIEAGGEDFDPRRDGALAAITALAVLFIFNLHQAAALIAGVVLGVAILMNWRAGRRRWAGLLFAMGLLSAIPMIVSMMVQAPYLRSVAQDFWIVTPLREAAWIMTSTLLKAVALNAAALGAAALVLTEAWRARRTGAMAEAPAPGAFGFAAVMMIGLVAACIAMLVLNAVKPLIIPRYLITLVPYGGAAVAALGARVLLSRAWVFALFIANAALVCAFVTEDEAFTGNWNDNAEVIQEQVAECPSTLVYAIDPARLNQSGVPEHTPPNAPAVHEWGYAYEGAVYGFHVVIDRPAEVKALPRARDCPTLLWGEHTYGMGLTQASAPQIARYAHLPLDAASLAHATFTLSDSGFVLSVPAPAPPRP